MQLQLANQQVLAQSKRSTSYGQVTSRIDSGLPRKPGESPEKARSVSSSRKAPRYKN